MGVHRHTQASISPYIRMQNPSIHRFNTSLIRHMHYICIKTPTLVFLCNKSISEAHIPIERIQLSIPISAQRRKMLLKLLQMFLVNLMLSFSFICINICPTNRGDTIDSPANSQQFSSNGIFAKVQIAILIRNKAHSLPYFLGNLERLHYPKSDIGLYIRVDHSEDNSSSIVDTWLSHMRHKYHHVNYEVSNAGERFADEEVVTQWSKLRYGHIIGLRNEALKSARESWADYLFMIDADVMVINENILQDLMVHKVPIISPLLNCTNIQSYSNFWGEMTKAGYYKRSDDYFDIQRRQKKGIFKVPMVHTVYLINLNLESTVNLTFSPSSDNKYPLDDIILFAKSAEQNNASMYVDNMNSYGYFTSPIEDGGFSREMEIFNHLKFQIMLDREDHEDMFVLKPSVHLSETLPVKSKLGFDQIYLINLKRRPDRRVKMEYLFDQLGIEAKYFEAVDGKQLNKTYLDSINVKQLPGYSDPYHKRDLKMGEIGCFLSHYFIWQDMVANKYEKILIFEDDIRFGPGFQRSLQIIMKEAEVYKSDWELFYLGRKRMSNKEQFVNENSHLVYPDYTYWTLSYILNQKGVKKLLDQDPLPRLTAVDEYLPIMFDRHPQDDWKDHFTPRDLVAISAEPLLLEPTHYTGEPRYISDTEDSTVIEDLE